MKELNRKAQGISTYGQQMSLTVGVVKNNADPAHHGRLQVYVPSLDNEDFNVVDLPWCWYVTPFGGVTTNFKVGREQKEVPGISAYGMWNVPKNGAQVLIGCIDGNPENRFWIGCVYMPEHNRTLPAGIDGVETEIDESGAYPQKVMGHYEENLSAAGLWRSDDHFKTRGGYERSVSHPSNKNKNKPTDNGYAPKPLESDKADSQTFSFTSPGKHYMVFSDVDEYCRVRIRTTEGQQIIFDDTNERIYISTAKGRNWIELDETNGKIYIYSDSKVNIRAKNDINMYSDENINIVANKRVNIRSEERSINLLAKHDVRADSSDADIMLTASRDVHIKTLNGPKAPRLDEEKFCEKPTKGWVYRWPEKGGSDTSYIRLDAVENVEIKSDEQKIHITGKSEVHMRSVDSTVNLQARDDINIKTDSTINLQASTDINIKADSTISNQAGVTINIKAGTAINEQAPTINHDAPEIIGLNYYGTFIGVHVVSEPPTPSPANDASQADSATAAEESTKVPVVKVIDHMVRPNHESWTRDEDEPFCKTTRNGKYQG